MGSWCILLFFSDSLTVANGERLFLFGLIHIAGLSNYRSINYTVLAVCSSLREPIRAEWRATNMLSSANNKLNY